MKFTARTIALSVALLVSCSSRPGIKTEQLWIRVPNVPFGFTTKENEIPYYRVVPEKIKACMDLLVDAEFRELPSETAGELAIAGPASLNGKRAFIGRFCEYSGSGDIKAYCKYGILIAIQGAFTVDNAYYDNTVLLFFLDSQPEEYYHYVSLSK